MNATGCSAEDVLAAMTVLRSQVPGEHPEINEGTVAVWHVALALFPQPVVQHVALSYSWSRFPSREEFREACVTEARRRSEEEAGRVLADGAPDACPACRGSGWELLDPVLWIVAPCPRGCVPPLPFGRRAEPARPAGRRRRSAGPSKIDRTVTDRITGERATDDF